MEGWKLFGGKEIKDVGKYVKDFVKENPEVELAIGTDARRHKHKTVYASAICFRFPSKGVHIIYRKEKIPYNRDKTWEQQLFPKLWKEVEMSKELADYLKEQVPNVNFEVHLDLNPDEVRKSNIAHDSGVGYILGSGYDVKTKSDSWAATYAADLISR